MDKKNIAMILIGLGIGFGVGTILQQTRIDALIKANDDLTEMYIRQTIEAALELHKDDWTFTDEERETIEKAGFKIK